MEAFNGTGTSIEVDTIETDYSSSFSSSPILDYSSSSSPSTVDQDSLPSSEADITDAQTEYPNWSFSPMENASTTMISEEEVQQCTFLDYNYDPVTTTVAVALFLFGILFCMFGYRCFKSVLFLIGFSFGVVIVFLICQVEDLLPQYGNVGISTLAGFLYGLICLLVPYVGFFTLGFHAGLLVGLASMIFFPTGYSIWISVIFLLGAGLFGAVANVCFPTLTILTTSLIGGASIAISFDYFVEKLRMANWVWSHVRAKEDIQFCWFSWLLLALWPCLLIVGVIIQSLLTANGFTLDIYGYKSSKRNPPTRRRLTREERAMARQAKYRYLYQVRTAGGDIVSQAYIQFLQNKSQQDTLSTHMSTLQTNSQEDESITN